MQTLENLRVRAGGVSNLRLENPVEDEFVCVAPGTDFFDSDKGKKRIRIALVESAERLRRAMELLKISLGEYPGRLT